MRILIVLSLLLLAVPALGQRASQVPAQAQKAAAYAVSHYDADQIELLAELVRFKTFHKDGIKNSENPEFRAFAKYIEDRAREFGLDFTDLGAVLVVSLGNSENRIGIITHGDVQPAIAENWGQSPFELDMTSEPGRLIARGAEDDKGAIATALYAMKAIKELGIPLERRIELVIGLTEESNHEPFLDVLARWSPPQINIGIDASYPVVVAEKGWGGVWVKFAADQTNNSTKPLVTRYQGGLIMSQVPADATLVIQNADAATIKRIRNTIKTNTDELKYQLEPDGKTLTIHVTGKAAHSSQPENGRNALAFAADLLNDEHNLNSPAGQAVNFVNALIGTGLYGKRFGDIAYSHPFMGPLTLNLSMARTTADGVELGINVRAPAGKSAATLEKEIRAAINAWAKQRGIPAPTVRTQLSNAYLPEQPVQVEPLLAVFEHYTGQQNPQPISIGGGTFARWLPNAVNFGPAMPGVPYTGHSEHEFITRQQMTLNLKMYTAMMVWLASETPH